MFVGNVYFFFNIDRCKVVLVKIMLEFVDVFFEKRYKKLLGKCKSDLFGKYFLK